jgi:predicted dehydrogenase
VGYGYWGTNILRNLVEMPGVGNIAVCDHRPERLKIAGKVLPDAITGRDFREIVHNSDIDAVIIATPTASHYEIARYALEYGKHVMLEKPMTSSSAEATDLIHTAENRGLVISVDHTFLHNGAIRVIKDQITNGQTGEINYIDCTRINLGIYQPDVNVMWDLASHDLSIVNFLIDEAPTHVRAIGKYNKLHQRVDNAYLFLYYPSGLLVQVNCSWASPVKIRQIILGGSRKMIIYDDIEPSHKLKIYDYSAVSLNDETRKKILVDYRLGDVIIPKFSTEEPLRAAIEDFLHCIQTGNKPISDARGALRIISILEKAELSLKNNGTLIEI